MTESLSSAFFRLPAADREAAQAAACAAHGVDDFYDLDAADRQAVYESALSVG